MAAVVTKPWDKLPKPSVSHASQYIYGLTAATSTQSGCSVSGQFTTMKLSASKNSVNLKPQQLNRPKMPQKLVPLTYAEHVALGAELKAMRERLLDIVIRSSRSYGVRASVTKRADRAAVSVDQLRCVLDSILCQSLPATDGSWCGVYYGNKS